METNAFYTDAENDLEFCINKLNQENILIQKELTIINKYKDGNLDKNTAITKIYNLNKSFYKSDCNSPKLTEEERVDEIVNGVVHRVKKDKPFDILGINDDIVPELLAKKSENTSLIKEYKEKFKSLLNDFSGIRTVRDSHLSYKNIISIFDSNLTRTTNMKHFELSDNLVVIRVYYFKVAEDITLNGFMWNGEKYIYLSSSAGQIRKKKMVFIKESVWEEHKNTIMCGLTVDKINKKGGINGNKFLAYLALCNSATDIWQDFDMRKAIVVNDLKTIVNGEVDFFDDKTYEITRKLMDIPIEHTDGCGMMLPKVCNKNRMIRAPWVKGLLSPFDYKSFVEKFNGNTKIKDIYGKEYDIVENDIQIILTKSQFKMWKYFDSWQEYVDNYEKYNCTTGYCNEEPNYIGKSKTTYQMMQTLVDISNDELKKVSLKTNDVIKKLSTDVKAVMDVMGIDDTDEYSSEFQQAVKLYPEMVGDVYTKEKIRSLKYSIIKDARSGKLDMDAKYSFVIPDLYAFCEYLFLGIENPNGLLKNGQVYCSMFDDKAELDCLRSPHLDNAHAIRNNVVDKIKQKWLVTKGIYISKDDLISKMLQLDWDGDQLLISKNKLFVEIAKRNTKGDVPMYYEMAQAKAEIIDNKKLFDGLILAFTSGNIGVPSNDISKEWNKENPSINLIKILCAEVNYNIDFAKTLYKPTRPDYINEKLRPISKRKVPFFFRFAKDKTDNQVENINNSTVNRLYKIIKSPRTVFKFENEDFDYRMLMKNHNIDMGAYDKICKLYDYFRMSRYNLSANTEKAIEKRETNFLHRRKEFIKHFKNIDLIVDVLIRYLYKDGKDSKYKDILWYCFGDVMLENLKKNLENRYYLCKCGKKFYAEYHNQKFCKECSTYVPIDKKIVICVDCGCEFEVGSKSNWKERCDACYKIYRKNKIKENVAKYRAKDICNQHK